MKPTITWVLIADGARGKVLRNDGPGKGLRQALDREFIGTRLKSGELVSDSYGEQGDRAGQGRRVYDPPTDPQRHEQQNFAKDIAEVLDKAAAKNEFDRLVLVAPPKTLGDLRDALAKPTRDKVSGELAKDLTTIPDNKLADHLGEVMAP